MVIFTTTLQEKAFEEENRNSFERYGIYPRCRNCPEKCHQPNVPMLLRLVCKRSPEWETENARLNGNRRG